MPSFLKDSFARCRIVDRFFSSNILNILSHSLLAWKISFEQSAHYGNSLKYNVFLSLAALKSFLSLTFRTIWVTLLISGVLWASWIQMSISFLIFQQVLLYMGFPCGSDGKESACNAGDLGLIPGLGRSPGGGHGNPLQYSGLENLHGQRSLVGYSPWIHKESDLTEQLSPAHIAFIHFLPLYPPGVHIMQILFLLMVSCKSHRLSSALFLWRDSSKCPVIASFCCMVSSDFKALY